MIQLSSKSMAFLFLSLGLPGASDSLGQQVKLVERLPDPHGSPRPARDARDVPLRTSLYFELGVPRKATGPGGEPRLRGRPHFSRRGAMPSSCSGRAAGSSRAGSGWLKPKCDLSGGKSLAVYIEPARPSEARDDLYVHVSASLEGGAGQARGRGDLELHHRGGPVGPGPGVPAQPEDRAGPVARPVLLGSLQRDLLHPGGELRADV